jgi:hypothetical protein
VLVLVVVLVLDLLGSCVQTRPESSRTTSFYQRDGEITSILEHGRARLLKFLTQMGTRRAMHANSVYKRAACYFLIKPGPKLRRSTILCVKGTTWHERCLGPNQIPVATLRQRFLRLPKKLRTSFQLALTRNVRSNHHEPLCRTVSLNCGCSPL